MSSVSIINNSYGPHTNKLNRDNILSNENVDEKNKESLYTFPYMVWDNATSNSPVACITQCQLFGFNAAGVEYGSQCCKYSSIFETINAQLTSQSVAMLKTFMLLRLQASTQTQMLFSTLHEADNHKSSTTLNVTLYALVIVCTIADPETYFRTTLGMDQNHFTTLTFLLGMMRVIIHS